MDELDVAYGPLEPEPPPPPRPRKRRDWKRIALVAAGVGAGSYALYRLLRPPTVAEAVRGLLHPRGKGAFIRTLSLLGPPDRLVQLAQSMGLQWVTIEVIWQESATQSNIHNLSTIRSYARALQDAGIKVWVWGFPHRDAIPGFVQTMVEFAEAVDADGYVVDAESGMRKATHDQARQLVAGLRESGRPVGVASYSAPWAHPVMPYAAFAQTADFGMPMVYDRHGVYQGRYAAWVQGWEELGFRAVVPIFGASSDTNLDEMRYIFSSTPVPDDAAAWWDLLHLRDRPGAQAYLRGITL